jgi:hypothetical protein
LPHPTPVMAAIAAARARRDFMAAPPPIANSTGSGEELCADADLEATDENPALASVGNEEQKTVLMAAEADDSNDDDMPLSRYSSTANRLAMELDQSKLPLIPAPASASASASPLVPLVPKLPQQKALGPDDTDKTRVQKRKAETPSIGSVARRRRDTHGDSSWPSHASIKQNAVVTFDVHGVTVTGKVLKCGEDDEVYLCVYLWAKPDGTQQIFQEWIMAESLRRATGLPPALDAVHLNCENSTTYT